MNESSYLCGAGMALLVLLMAGCATGPTRLESTYGTAYHAARVSQTLHPEAPTNLALVEEFDGQAAKYVLDRYRSMFEKPPPPPSFAISVGGVR